jgi:hypothetical protein
MTWRISWWTMAVARAIPRKYVNRHHNRTSGLTVPIGWRRRRREYCQLSDRAAAVHQQLLMAGHFDGGRQLTGIINPDDRFRDASSPDRLFEVDPQLPVGLSKCRR